MKWLGTETVPDHADYRLMSRAALQALSQYKESNLFLRGLVPSLGFKTAKVYYKRGTRVAGESKYPLKKMVSFAIEGVTSFSTKPLTMITGLGLFSVFVGIVMLIYTLFPFSRACRCGLGINDVFPVDSGRLYFAGTRYYW